MLLLTRGVEMDGSLVKCRISPLLLTSLLFTTQLFEQRVMFTLELLVTALVIFDVCL